MRTIRRYANRKLYDVVAKKYTTLQTMETAIASGEEIQVLDHATKQDLTTQTLAQIIFAAEVRRPSQKASDLYNLIRAGFSAPSSLPEDHTTKG